MLSLNVAVFGTSCTKGQWLLTSTLYSAWRGQNGLRGRVGVGRATRIEGPANETQRARCRAQTGDVIFIREGTVPPPAGTIAEAGEGYPPCLTALAPWRLPR